VVSVIEIIEDTTKMNERGIPGRSPAGRDLYGGGRGGMVVVGVAAGRGGRCGSNRLSFPLSVTSISFSYSY